MFLAPNMDVRFRHGVYLPHLNLFGKADESFELEKAEDPLNDRLKSTSSTNLLRENQSFQCFQELLVRVNSGKLWNAPFKFVQVAVRELSVLLILIETLILLAGYLIILGVHHTIRFGINKLRFKSNDQQVPIRYQYQPIPRPMPRRVPRGRMAGG